jgi:Skp family chaperone for outer membrane proteins
MPKDDVVPDPNERLLDALTASTKVTTEVIGHIKGMTREFQALRESTEKEFSHLRETFNGRLGDLEEAMKSTNAHLDNLVRETVVTNNLLREDMDDRKAQQAHRLQVEGEEREWRRKVEERQLDRKEKIEDDTRGFVKKYTEEFWGVFKQPFGYLVAGVIFWLLIRYFAVPPTAMVPQPVLPHPVEQVGKENP